MRKIFRVLAVAATTATAAGSMIVSLSTASSADSTTPPPWDTFSPTDGATYGSNTSPSGYGAVGSLLFYNSAGQQITGGSITSTPFAAYVAGSVSTGGTKAQIYIASPAANDPSGWTTATLGNSATAFPNSGAPSNLSGSLPVFTGSSGEETLSSFVAANPASSDPDAGYYQVRLVTSGAGASGTEENAADIYINTSDDTWTLAYSDDAFAGHTASTPSPVGSSVSLATSPGSSSVQGTNVTLTATVTDADGSSPVGGTVQFKDGSSIVNTIPATVGSNGQASLTTSTLLPQGNDSLTAVFTPVSGTNYSGSTSSAVVYDVTPPVSTDTTLVASPPSPVTTGTPETFTATVSDSDSSVPTGTVTFNDGSSPLATAVALIDNGGSYQATYTSSALSIATHSLAAVYNPPLGYASSTGNLSFTVTPSGDPTSTALAVNPTQVAPGGSITFTANVEDTTSNTAVPTIGGTVQFAVNGTDVGSAAAISAGVATETVTVPSPVVAPWNTLVNGLSDNEVTATFSGSSAYALSSSSPVEVFVSASGYGSDTNANGSGNITTNVPVGTLTITTPYTNANPFTLGTAHLNANQSEYVASAPFGNTSSTASLSSNGGVEIQDTGIGNQSWTASVSVTDFSDGAAQGAGDVINGQNLEFTNVTQADIPGNSYGTAAGDTQIQTNDVATVPTATGYPYGWNQLGSTGVSDGIHNGSSGASPVVHQFADSASAGDGSVFVDGLFTLFAPTSVNPGTYTATLTFTAV
jgi:hypothetical protein